jgi:hypothetical protein
MLMLVLVMGIHRMGGEECESGQMLAGMLSRKTRIRAQKRIVLTSF